MGRLRTENTSVSKTQFITYKLPREKHSLSSYSCFSEDLKLTSTLISQHHRSNVLSKGSQVTHINSRALIMFLINDGLYTLVTFPYDCLIKAYFGDRVSLHNSAILELTLQTRLALNPQRSTSLCLLSAKNKSGCV